MMRKKPMLAYPVSAKPIDYSKPTFIQPKLDGVRCVIQYDAGVVTAYSRTGKEWKNIEHIKLNLYRFFSFPSILCSKPNGFEVLITKNFLRMLR